MLFIAIDDLRPTLGCYGDPYAVTPNIDTFATKSFLFENTYCQQSVSGPSRASLLTGLRPDEIGVTDLNTHFREKCPYITTLPQLFKNNGYETIGIGKIYHGSTRTQDTISWTRPPIYNLSIKKEEYTLMQNRQGNKAATIEIADQPDTSFLDGKVTAEALKRLDKLSKSKQPFFLAVGYIKPHLPFSMPKKYWDIYRNKSFIRKEAEDKQPIHAPVISFHNWEELRGYTDIPKHGNLSIEKQEELVKLIMHVSVLSTHKSGNYWVSSKNWDWRKIQSLSFGVTTASISENSTYGGNPQILNWIAKFLYLYTAQNIKMPRKE